MFILKDYSINILKNKELFANKHLMQENLGMTWYVLAGE